MVGNLEQGSGDTWACDLSIVDSRSTLYMEVNLQIVTLANVE